MNIKIFEARIRQVHALDINAFDIYSDLTKLITDKDLKKQIRGIAADEKRHVALTQAILTYLKK